MTARHRDDIAGAEQEPRDSPVSDRLYAARDRLLESAEFQRFSAGFLPTRGIANRSARTLFDLCAGFVYSQILYACVSLKLFAILKDGPKTVADLSRRMALPQAAAERLLLAAASLKLVSKRSGNRFGLGLLGAALNGNPAIGAMIEHHAMLYRDLQDPVALLRGERQTELSRYWAYAGAGDEDDIGAEQVAAYSALMAASQSFIAEDVLDAYPFRKHKRLIDVGGGEGAFIRAAAMREPHLQFDLFDLPAVADRARKIIERERLDHRVSVTGGSFLEDALPRGADVMTLVRVLHDHDDDAVLRILGAVAEALPRGGTLVIAEPLAETKGAEPVGHAYFGFYLLAMGQGRARTFGELKRMLAQSGFSAARQMRARRPLFTGVITAIR